MENTQLRRLIESKVDMGLGQRKAMVDQATRDGIVDSVMAELGDMDPNKKLSLKEATKLTKALTKSMKKAKK